MKETITASTFDPSMAHDTLIISCNTVRKELEHAMKTTGITYPVIYLKSNLHDIPKILNASLQDLIDEASESGIKKILLGYATCGNSVAGLQTRNCKLILPRVEDCLRFFFPKGYKGPNVQGGIYYLTYGWLYDEGHGLAYYRQIMEEYGEELGQEIYDMMMINYKYVGLIDTHCYPVNELLPDAERYAASMKMRLLFIDGDNHYLEQLLTGPHPSDTFLTFEPGHCITEKELVL